MKTAFTRGNIGTFACLPTRPAEPFDVKHDEDGFRNEKDLSSAQIAAFGDSYVESPQLPGAFLATTHLAALQQKTVVNLGQSGFGPQQELAVLERYALPLHPQLIIWVFYEGNDLAPMPSGPRERVVPQQYLGLDEHNLGSILHQECTLGARCSFLENCVPDQRMAGNYGTVLGDDGEEYRTYFNDPTMTVAPTVQELEGLKTTTAALKTAYEMAQNQRC